MTYWKNIGSYRKFQNSPKEANVGEKYAWYVHQTSKKG